ncbi:MAG: TonB-dependent receptor, partial [Bacteroidota bacterium]|nr:TonB-dependent receptor [Bacteroidota bacterium]
MQRIILTLLGSIMACGAIAQTITGKVSDLYSRSGLEGVLVTNLTNGKMTTTGKNGTFNLIGNEGNVFRFHLLGYEDQEVPARSTPMNILLQPGNYNLNTVEVSSSRIENNENQRVPQSIAVVSSKDLQRFNGVFLEEPMNLIPGVRMDKRTMSGGQRITIRGYGNASNFTGTGYKAYINGIPLTDAEGNTFMDDIDFASLGQVEVIKG